MLFLCWASVEDGGPTLKQHWVNASCLLGMGMTCLKMEVGSLGIIIMDTDSNVSCIVAT